MKKLSVVLITFNRSNYLKKAIEAVLSQSYANFEFIIMDNGSSEEIRDIISSYNDSRIVLDRRETNSITYMNKAFSLAKGDYIIITHDDDMMTNNFLEREVEILNKDKEVVLVASNTELINARDEVISKTSMDLKTDRVFGKYEFIAERIINNICLPCPTVMLRKSFIEKHSIRFNFEVGPSFDDYMWYTINLHDVKLYLIKDPIFKYRVHDGQTTNPVLNITMRLQIFPHIIKLLEESGNSKLTPVFKKKSIKAILDYLMTAYASKIINGKEFEMYYKCLLEMGVKYYEIPNKFRLKKYFFENFSGIYQRLQNRN